MQKATAKGGYLGTATPPHREASCNFLEFRAIIHYFSLLSSIFLQRCALQQSPPLKPILGIQL